MPASSGPWSEVRFRAVRVCPSDTSPQGLSRRVPDTTGAYVVKSLKTLEKEAS
jgi:hypothetical protein